jgi:hypothetical protein
MKYEFHPAALQEYAEAVDFFYLAACWSETSEALSSKQLPCETLIAVIQ